MSTEVTNGNINRQTFIVVGVTVIGLTLLFAFINSVPWATKSDLASTLASINQRLEKIETAQSTYTSQIGDMHAQLATTTQSLTDMQTQLAAVSTQLAAFTKSLTDMQIQLAGTTAEVRARQSANAARRQRANERE